MQMARELSGKDLGGATIPAPAVVEVTTQGKRFDRIVILSDMCCYTSTWSPGFISLPQALLEYSRRVTHPYVYSVNLTDDSQGSQVSPNDPKALLVSGFSEKIFDLMVQFEAGGEDMRSIPALEQIRGRYLIKQYVVGYR